MPGIFDTIYSERKYVAPTVYKLNGITPAMLPRVSYYNSLAKATAQYRHYTTGSPAVTADGAIEITNTGPQTIGINADFYIPVLGSWWIVGYDYVKNKYSSLRMIIARVHTPDGTGPVFIVAQSNAMGLAATVVWGSPDQVAALDQFYREVALLKYRYNALSAFLNTLGSRPMSTREQQIYSQGYFMLIALSAQISTIDGIEVYYNKEGKIGVIPFLLIAAIAIFAGATAWAVSKIVSEKEKTRRINDAFELNKWIGDKIHEITADPALSDADKSKLIRSLEQSKDVANKIAIDSTKDSKGLFGNIADIVKWGVVGLLAFKAMQMIDEHKKRS